MGTPDYTFTLYMWETIYRRTCSFGGYPTLRHNEIRNLTANLSSEVCHKVSISPTLQPVTGETFKLASDSTDIWSKIRPCS